MKDENLNSTDSNVVSGTTTDGILTINVTYNFLEGKFYGLQIFSLNGGDEYEAFVLRVQKDSGTMEADACLALAIVTLIGLDAEYLLSFQKIYATDQTDYDNYSVLDNYYTQPTKAETEYVVKPTT